MNSLSLPCEPLSGARETESHLRVRDDCHVSALSGSGRDTSCDYHYGIKGHSTKNCQALKNQVQALKNAGYVNFDYDKAGGPNVVTNPLPNHSEPKINVVLESSTEGRKTCIKDVMTSMGVQVRVLYSRRRKVAKERRMSKGYCQYYAEV